MVDDVKFAFFRLVELLFQLDSKLGKERNHAGSMPFDMFRFTRPDEKPILAPIDVRPPHGQRFGRVAQSAVATQCDERSPRQSRRFASVTHSYRDRRYKARGFVMVFFVYFF